MAGMAGIISEIEQQRQQAKTAFLKGDYEKALRLAQVTLGDLALIPDGEKAGDAGAKITFIRESLQQFIEQIKQARKSSQLATADNMGMTIHPMTFQSERSA